MVSRDNSSALANEHVNTHTPSSIRWANINSTITLYIVDHRVAHGSATGELN